MSVDRRQVACEIAIIQVRTYALLSLWKALLCVEVNTSGSFADTLPKQEGYSKQLGPLSARIVALPCLYSLWQCLSTRRIRRYGGHHRYLSLYKVRPRRPTQHCHSRRGGRHDLYKRSRPWQISRLMDCVDAGDVAP